ncbi:dihydrodipicolinate synthase family protein [Actinoallomurus sp. NPDC050550]|uniref:dihydrodipicolinate synthase family protein n=1 Tax=Actinoallomurus sp. NPDC050550 TaxID=3154937 RepID=UPI0033E439EA
MKPPTGTWATVLLPLDEDDELRWEHVGEQVDQIIAAGVDGVYTGGSAAEFWTQDEAEVDRLTALVAERCASAGMPFQIGCAHPSPQVALHRLRRARELAPAAIQVILPDWFAVSDREAIAFLRRLADEATPVPLVLYNPPHSKRVLAPDEYGRLCGEIPEIIGLKVGDGDDVWYEAMRPVMERVSVFVPGHHLASGHRRGAAGAYSNVACLNPRAAVAWWHAIRDGLPAAMSTEARLNAFIGEFIQPLQREYCNAALDKLLATIGGWCPIGTRLRWPYSGVPAEHAETLRTIARERLPDFVSSGSSTSP